MGGFSNLLPIIADVAATATGNPELIPLIHGGNSLAHGEGIGGALKSAGTAYAGSELLSGLGGLFPETAGSLGLPTGGNSISDLFGGTSGAGSFFGPGTIGGDFSGNFSSGSGLDNIFGNTATGQGGTPTLNSDTLADRAATSAGATPAPGLTGANNASGISNAGGGTAGGFVNAPDVSGDFSLAGSGQLPAVSSSPFSQAGNISDQFQNAAGFGTSPTLASGASSVASNSSGQVNNLLRSLFTGLTTDTNQSGYEGMNAAAQQAAGAYQPFLQNGTTASNTLSALYGNNGAEAQQSAQAGFTNTPGYQFARDQGISALDASAAARGNLLSGNQIKATQDYGTGLANQTYQQYVQNLQSQAGQGQQAANGYGSALVGGANALAQDGQASANNNNQMYGGAINALFPGNSLADLLKGNYGNNSVLSSLFG